MAGDPEEIAEVFRGFARLGFSYLQVGIFPNSLEGVEAFAPVLEALTRAVRVGRRISMKGTKLQKGLLVFTFLLAGVYIAGGASFVVGYASGALDWDPSDFETVNFGAALHLKSGYGRTFSSAT